MPARMRTLLLICLAALLTAPAAATASLSPGDLAVVGATDDVALTDGGGTADISDIQADGDRVYVAGDFNLAGPRTGPAALVSGTSGRLEQALGHGIDQGVQSAVEDGHGGLILGGTFTTPRTGLLHLRADGSVDPDFPQLPRSGSVSQSATVLVRRGDTLYVGGGITAIIDADGTHARTSLAAIDLTTDRATAWAPSCTTEGLETLAVSDTAVYAGGMTPIFSCEGVPGLTKISRDSGAVDTAFAPNPRDAYNTGRVRALALHGDELYVGGSFMKIGSPQVTRTSLARVDAATGAVSAESHAFSNANGVYTMAIADDRLYLGGDWTDVDAVAQADAAPNLAAIDLGNAARPIIRSFHPRPKGTVYTMRLDARGGLLIAGNFNTLRGGGDAVGGLQRAFSARLDATTGAADGAWAADSDAQPRVLLPLADGRVLVAGYMTMVAGQSRPGVAAFDRRSGKLLPWSPPDTGSRVNSVSARDGAVYLAGPFTSIGGVPRAHLAKVSAADGALDPAWNPGADDDVILVRAAADGLYVLGNFHGTEHVGGAVRQYVARLAAGGNGAADGWAPDPDNYLNTMAVAPDGVYLAGGFTHASGAARAGLVKVDRAGGAAVTGWTPPSVSGGEVGALATADDDLIVAGDFTAIAGDADHRYLARLRGSDGGLVADWRPSPPGERSVLAAGSGLLLDDGYNDSGDQTLFARPLAGAGTADPGFVTDWYMSVGAVAGQTVWAAGWLKVGGVPHSIALLRVRAPEPATAPQITGGAMVGAQAHCDTGSWTREPQSYTYVWLRDEAPVDGADRADYTVSPADAGHALRCRVTAANDGGAATATSDAAHPASAPAPNGADGPGPGSSAGADPGAGTGACAAIAQKPSRSRKPATAANAKLKAACRREGTRAVRCLLRFSGSIGNPTRLNATLTARGRTVATARVRAAKGHRLGRRITVVLRGRRAVRAGSATLTVRLAPRSTVVRARCRL